jgi:uncharacterized RDD family membrane protein YckC
MAGMPAAAHLSFGGFWIRFAAYLIDALILGIPSGVVIAVAIFLFGGLGVLLHRGPTSDPREAMALLAPLFMALFVAWGFLLILHWLYYAAMESSARQATFGKSILSLRVTNSEGRRLTFGHATGRFFAKIVSGLIPLGIGYIIAGFTAKKQAVHDFIAGTLVLRN